MKESILMIFMLVSLVIICILNKKHIQKYQYNFANKELVSHQIKEQVKKECLK